MGAQPFGFLVQHRGAAERTLVSFSYQPLADVFYERSALASAKIATGA
jgi:hypothetical protein